MHRYKYFFVCVISIYDFVKRRTSDPLFFHFFCQLSYGASPLADVRNVASVSTHVTSHTSA